MRKLGLDKKRHGFTLIELMVALSVGSIAIGGISNMLFSLRYTWNEAASTLDLNTDEGLFQDRLIRGGFGYGTGLQSAKAKPVLYSFDDGGETAWTVVYENGNNNFYAVHFGADQTVRLIKQADSHVWWSAKGSKVEERVLDDLQIQILNISQNGTVLMMDYSIKVQVGDSWCDKKGQFSWGFRLS